MTRSHARDHLVTVVVAFVSAFYGVALTQGAQLLDDLFPDDTSAGATVLIVAYVFIGLGAYAAAVVTANSFATIVAGRVREIAQYRLLGSSAANLRGRLTLEGVAAGLIGALLGLASGVIAYWAVVQSQIGSGALPQWDYTYISWRTVVPTLLAVITIAAAAWVGSAAVSRVSPVQALSASVEPPLDVSRTPIVQRVFALLGLIGGGVLMLGGAAIGAVSPLGLLIAFVGGATSFLGFVIGARMIVPRLLVLVGRAFGRSVPATLAAANAVRSPRAATRGTIGMIVGVTLVVMFVVAIGIVRVVALTYAEAEIANGADPMIREMIGLSLDIMTWITVALTSVGAVIGAAGMIANLSLGVLQRQRELGLLRAVGSTAGQLRSMITLEAVIISIVAIGAGAVLGTFYGWLGAQSTIGSLAGGLVPLVVPWWLLVVVGAAALVLAAVASFAPAIRATRVTPIQALAVQ